jgi:hypothetical protein
MRFRFSCPLILTLSLCPPAWSQGVRQQTPPTGADDSSSSVVKRVPSGVILVKGAWSSASDSVTPVPEGGSVVNHVFRDEYFRMTYPLPPGWIEKYKGPPPSDGGRYVLAQLGPADTFKELARGSILITAEDLFFTAVPPSNATELINQMKDNLQSDSQVELQPKQSKIADRLFTFLAYWSPVAQLHWYVVATEIRCRVVQIILTSHDTKLLADLIQHMNQMKLPAEANPSAGTGGGGVPVCIKDYARDENMIARFDPVFTEHRFNPVPVRIIIDQEGKIKHIHFLSAFPEQAKAITDALGQWKFKPYRRAGQLTEVETGILFGPGNAH